MLALGWLGAVACCLGYGAGSVVQSAGARRVALITGPAGLIRVLRQGPYLLGIALDAVAFLGSLVAAQRLPLFLRQTIMTASVAVTALLAALGGTRLSGRQWSAIAGLMVGLGLPSAAARTGPASHPTPWFGWIVLASCLLPAVLGDSVAAGWGAAAVIGFLMVVSGAAGLVWRTDAGFLSGGGENAGT